MKKRLFALLLTAIMLVGLLPTTVAAADVSVSNNVIDIADNQITIFKVTHLSISGATVVSADQNGTTIDVVLAGDTSPAAKLTATFTGTSNGGRLNHTNNTCTLSNGSGVMRAGVQPFGGPAPQGPLVTYTINFSTVKGAACSVSLPSGEGYTIAGEDTAYEGGTYSFTVAVSDGYTGKNMVVKANGEPLTGTGGRYEISNVSVNLVITVEGVAKKAEHSVSLPSGEGYTATGNTTVYEGDDYTFTIAIAEGYTGATMVVKANEETLADTNGKYTVANVTADLVISVAGVAKRTEYAVTLPSGEGYTATGEATVYEGDDYNFTIAIAKGYTGAAMVVKVNDEPLTGANGKYTVSNVSGNLAVTVEGVAKKVVCAVTLPTGAGYTITGASTVYKGENYTFTIAIHTGYTGEAMVVKANNEVLTDANGKYTVSDVSGDLVITVEGVQSTGVTPTTIYSGKNKPHSLGYISTIVVDQVQAEANQTVWVGDHAYVTLVPETADNAVARIKFTTVGNSLSMSDADIPLIRGAGEKTFTAKASIFGTWTFTIHLSSKGYPPTLADGVSATAEDTAYVGAAYELNVAELFHDCRNKPMTYAVKRDGGKYVPIEGNTYTFTTEQIGTTVLEFKANNGEQDSQQTYTLTLTAVQIVERTMTVQAPKGLDPTFYVTESFDDAGKDTPGQVLTAIPMASEETGTVSYTVTYPSSAKNISYRDPVWGGGAFAAVENGTTSLRQVQVALIDPADKPLAGTMSVSGGGRCSVPGQPGQYLLAVGSEYTYTAVPENSAVYTTPTLNQLLEEGEAIHSVALHTGIKNQKTITVSDGATARLFAQSKYYSSTEFPAVAVVDNPDATTTYYFSAAANDMSWRVSSSGHITKAGYWKSNLTVLHSEVDAKADSRPDYTLGSNDNCDVAEDSVLLNINRQNHLTMSVGETKTLKAYRAWEIIQNYLNHIIAPDFTYTILSGEDVVSLTDKAAPMNEQGSWKTLKALKEGTAVIEVTYDAIQIAGGSYDGVYGATNPTRTGLMVVTVGQTGPAVDFGIQSLSSKGKNTYAQSNAAAWDAEFDTLYFTGESGTITFSPITGGTITEVAVSGDKGVTWTVLTGTEGVYTAPILPGNNLLRVSTEAGSAYQVVRGDKIGVRLLNLSRTGQPFAPGDTVRVMLDGIHAPIPKISGNYNPGYSHSMYGGSPIYTTYTWQGETVRGPGKQYDFITQGNYVDVTILADAGDESLTLSQGYIGLGVIGLPSFADGGDSHRNIPDGGCATRGSETTYHTRSMLPDVVIEVGALPSGNTAPYVLEKAVGKATIEFGKTYAVNLDKIFADREGDSLTYRCGETTVDSYYTFTPDAVGTYALVFVANDGSVDSSSHTITLTVKAASTAGSGSSSKLDFGLDTDEIDGHVYISFEDKGKRVDGEAASIPKALGTIISKTKVPFTQGDTVADVTLRLLDAKGFTYSHGGTTKSDFYLASIGGFTVRGVDYESFGEFDAGAGSGWMITLNKEFIEQGASEFEVGPNDVIRWQYTCQFGEDIGDPFYSSGGGSVRPPVQQEKDEEKEEEKQPQELTELPFTDTRGHWANDAIRFVYGKGLMVGTGETTFEPETTGSRGMIMTILHNLDGNPEYFESHSFADVENEKYYSGAISWAVASGIVSGYGNGQFGPDDDVTREQLAVILRQYAKVKGYDVSKSAELTTFMDSDRISPWAQEALEWACGQGLISGKGGSVLDPSGRATRAEVATILMNFMEKVMK